MIKLTTNDAIAAAIGEEFDLALRLAAARSAAIQVAFTAGILTAMGSKGFNAAKQGAEIMQAATDAVDALFADFLTVNGDALEQMDGAERTAMAEEAYAQISTAASEDVVAALPKVPS